MAIDVASVLAESIETGELLTIKYHGGSSAGAAREIMPIQIQGDKVRARCYTSGAVKTFSIAKIELASKTIDQIKLDEVWDGRPTNEQPQLLIPKNSKEICADHREALIESGWHIIEQDDADQFGLYLHRKKKVGTGWLKSASASLSFEKYSWDYTVDLNGATVRENRQPRVRPWCVRGKKSTKTFKDYSKAASAFLEQVYDGPF